MSDTDTDTAQHTCINTATTSDGQPSPPCPACPADPVKFTKLPMGQAAESTEAPRPDYERIKADMLRAAERLKLTCSVSDMNAFLDTVNAAVEALPSVDAHETLKAELASLRREHLRISRLRAGLSLRPAAELLGIEPKRLGDLEHGRARASDEEWQSIFSRLTDAGNTGNA